MAIEKRGCQKWTFLKKGKAGSLSGAYAMPIEIKKTTGSQLTTGYNPTGQVPGKFYIYPEQTPDGLWTTPEDLGCFIIEVQKSLLGKSNKVLSKEMTTTMLTPVMRRMLLPSKTPTLAILPAAVFLIRSQEAK